MSALDFPQVSDPRANGGVLLTQAVCHYWAGPGREQDAALAWGFDIGKWFKRGVGEQPVVTAAQGEAVYLEPGHQFYGSGYYDKASGLYLNFWAQTARPPFPVVTIYEVRGLMSTTHPGDQPGETVFDKDGAWCLDYSIDPHRQAVLRDLPDRGPRWDGR